MDVKAYSCYLVTFAYQSMRSRLGLPKTLRLHPNAPELAWCAVLLARHNCREILCRFRTCRYEPQLSSINQNLLMTSDFFIVPTSPDYFSVMAVESLSTVIPRWHAWSHRAKANPILKSATYVYPDKNPKFLGTIIQRYRPRKGAPTEGFQKRIDTINDRIAKQLVPILESPPDAAPKRKIQTNPCVAAEPLSCPDRRFQYIDCKSARAQNARFRLDRYTTRPRRNRACGGPKKARRILRGFRSAGRAYY